MAYWRRARARRVARKRTYPTGTPAAATAELFASRRTLGLVSVAPGLDPAQAATAPVIGIIIEFLPTGPHQTARGDAPDTTERHKLAQLRPVHGLHAHRLELRRVRAPHDAQDHVGPDLRLLDERQ